MIKNNIMTLEDRTNLMVKKQLQCDKDGIKVDVIGMTSAFYEIQKEITGSYKHLLRADYQKYVTLMNDRYLAIFKQVDDVIVSRYKHNMDMVY